MRAIFGSLDDRRNENCIADPMVKKMLRIFADSASLRLYDYVPVRFGNDARPLLKSFFQKRSETRKKS